MHDYEGDPIPYIVADGDNFDVSTWTQQALADFGGEIEVTPRLTYPQTFRTVGGDLHFTIRDKVAATTDSRQLLYRWNKDTDSWFTRGADGVLINGALANPNKRGVYLGQTSGRAAGASTRYLHWTWSKQVAKGAGDFDYGGGGELYHDLLVIKTANNGQTWTDVEDNPLTLPVTYLTAPKALATGEVPNGIDAGNNNWPDASDNPHFLMAMTTPTAGFANWNHVYWDGAAWQRLDLPYSWHHRQLQILGVGSHMFGLGRPLGQNAVNLYDLTPGSGTYGEALVNLSTRPVTDGWTPAFDWSRLRNDGVLSFLVSPSHNSGVGGPYASVPAYLVEFDLAAYEATR
jgi:hypothetical protein